MESLYTKNRSIKYSLCVINVFSKYGWVKSLKDKKGETVLNAFIEIVKKSNRKANKLWKEENKGRELYKKLMQEWLDNNHILMYSTHNKGKYLTAGGFIKSLKSKIYKKMTANDSKPYLPFLNKLVE